MPEAWIINAVRSPVAKGHAETGAFRNVRGDDLGALVLSGLVEKSGIDPTLVEDILWGCAKQYGEQGFNVARQSALIAGLPLQVCGVTINRNCGSSMDALHQATRAIWSGCSDVLIIGGVEHMQRVGWDVVPDIGPGMQKRHTPEAFHMGLVCEHLAKKYSISRQEQDSFALASHHKAAQATNRGWFDEEILPVWGHKATGELEKVTKDQTIRPGTTLEALAKLEPAFMKDGTITAGNASPYSVGSAGMLVMSDIKAKELGLKPMAKVRAMAIAGNEPILMGIGPVHAMRKLLSKCPVDIRDIGHIEVNEAFASQTISVIREMNWNTEMVNPLGGALALGHPLGATGARILTTMVHSMQRNNTRYGLASMCIGGGQGIATLLELVS